MNKLLILTQTWANILHTSQALSPRLLNGLGQRPNNSSVINTTIQNPDNEKPRQTCVHPGFLTTK